MHHYIFKAVCVARHSDDLKCLCLAMLKLNYNGSKDSLEICWSSLCLLHCYIAQNHPTTSKHYFMHDIVPLAKFNWVIPFLSPENKDWQIFAL